MGYIQLYREGYIFRILFIELGLKKQNQNFLKWPKNKNAQEVNYFR